MVDTISVQHQVRRNKPLLTDDNNVVLIYHAAQMNLNSNRKYHENRIKALQIRYFTSS